MADLSFETIPLKKRSSLFSEEGRKTKLTPRIIKPNNPDNFSFQNSLATKSIEKDNVESATSVITFRGVLSPRLKEI